MKQFKAAIIGCGGIAQVHATVLKHLPCAELVACGDIRPERAEKMAAEYSCRAYSSLEALLEQETIDVLHICTPHYLHTPMVKLAEEKGIAVFTEKPPVISREQWAVLSAVTKVPVGVCFQNRYNKSVQYIRELLNSGKAGKILGARAFVTWCRGEAYYTESGWRGALSTEGGGVLINQSIHTMDLLTYFMGKPTSWESSCHNRHLKGVIEVEDTLEAYIRYGEATALFYATTAYSCDSPVLLELNCENCTIKMEEERVTVLGKDGTRQELQFSQPETIGKAYWGNGHYLCIADYYKSLDEGTKPPIGLPEVTNTVELMLGVYECARKEQR